jgi:hypothetical protein
MSAAGMVRCWRRVWTAIRVRRECSSTCRTAMAPAGEVFLVETVIPKDTADSDAAWTGRCWYSPAAGNGEGEYRDLLRRAG